jgi:hypothetical protein
MKKSLAGLAMILAATTGAGIAAAQSAAPLDLKGTWTGTSESIVRGYPPHHRGVAPTAHRLDNVLFTITITGQDGRRFWGTAEGAGNKEPITGVIGYDGKTIVAEDTDGVTHGNIIDADTIEVIYENIGRSTVIAVNRWKRQK